MTGRADRILRRARVTVRPGARSAGAAVSIRGGRIAAVGPEGEVLKDAGPETVVEDLDGAVLHPGFHDAHAHLTEGTQELAGIDLRGACSAEEVASRVAAIVADSNGGGWVRGWGWDVGMTDRARLDRVSPDRPVFLGRADGHAAWLNAAAFRALGEGEGPPDGVVTEEKAEALRRRLPPLPRDESERAIVGRLVEAGRAGLTTLEDVAGIESLRLLAAIDEAGRLPIRVSVWLPAGLDGGAAEEVGRLVAGRDGRVEAGTRKIFLDGTLGARTAAMIDPYDDAPGERGDLRLEAAEAGRLVADLDAAGWRVAIHAVGDRAFAVAVEALASASRREGRRHRIEHAQVVRVADVRRAAAAGIVASVQPLHRSLDAPWLEARLGRDRARVAYPLRSLSAAGMTLAFGSDWPVAPLDPLRGIAAAIDPSRGAEAIEVGEAIAAYVSGPAAASGAESRRGRIAPGFDADLVALTDDPCDPVPSRTLRDVAVIRTWVAGRPV